MQGPALFLQRSLPVEDNSEGRRFLLLRHQEQEALSIQVDIVQLLSVLPPRRTRTAIVGNQPLDAVIRDSLREGVRREGPNVNFITARFVGYVSDPTPVGRKTA